MNLFFHQGALGDWVLTFPILRGLEQRTAAITAWSKAALAAAVFEHVEPLNIELREFSRLHDPGGPAALGSAVGEVLETATLVISFVSDGRDAWAKNIGRLAPGARHVFVHPRPPADWPRHVCDWHRRQLREQKLEPLHAEIPDRADPGCDVLVHPGSGGTEKCWPPERYEQLIEALRASGRNVRVLLGEVEIETWSPSALDLWEDRYGAERLTSLETLRSRLASASLFIGNDSGPTHLAAQMGIPTVALFGPSSVTHWRPVGPSVNVLAPPAPQSMTWLSVDRVAQACGAA